MFSNEPRCRYDAHQLAEVICQLRFPEILAISERVPVDFQEAIREEFPQFVKRMERPAPTLTGNPGNMTLQNQPATINYQFSSADGAWRVNLTSKFISLSCTKYTGWENFARQLDKPLAAFIKVYKPAYFERIGLRYLNFISRFHLGLADQPFRDLISPCYLGPLSQEDVSETGTNRCSVDADIALRGGCRAKIHAGPGMVKVHGKQDQEIKFVFDQDLFMAGQLKLPLVAGALQTLHSQAWSIFRGAITEKLHDAMEPTHY